MRALTTDEIMDAIEFLATWNANTWKEFRVAGNYPATVCTNCEARKCHDVEMGEYQCRVYALDRLLKGNI
jgi:hypothetical protein